jgi:predicted outer membrane repeat protein
MQDGVTRVAGNSPVPGKAVMLAIRFAVLLSLLVPFAVQATPKHFHVGVGCTYTKIKDALDAERLNPGSPADFIWIVHNQAYTDQDVQIHDQNVFVYGGVDTCTDASVTGTTTLSGSGGAAKSVMTISGNSQVWLGGLTITQGDNSDSGVGGGINFVGTGKLTIGSSNISNNHAGYGGGINFRGTGGTDNVAELWINDETLITNNTAASSGGGIRIEGNARLYVTRPQVWIALNHADGGYGGGVQVIGPAQADLGSPGYLLAEYLGVIYENTAKYGGGISVSAGSGDFEDGYLRLFTTDAQHPLRIEGNKASQDGGGVHVKSDDGLIYQGKAELCASGYRITANSAKEGAAIYAISYDNTRNSRVYSWRQCGDSELDAVTCSSDDCNRIDGNVAQDISGHATPGSTILLHSGTEFTGGALRIEGNQGAHALRVLSGDTSLVTIADCLLDANILTSDLVAADAQTTLSLRNCTLANNQIAAGVAVRSGGILEMFDDIFAQGQTASLTYTGGNPNNLTIDYVMSMEVASLAQGSHVVQGDPSFVDPSHNDYRLLPTSAAIDVAPVLAGNNRDLDNRPRDLDSPNVPNLDGVRDLGAYERQVRYCGTADTLFCNNFEFD